MTYCGLFLPYPFLDSVCTRSWEGTQPEQLTPNDSRDIPRHMAYHIISYHIISLLSLKSWLNGIVDIFPCSLKPECLSEMNCAVGKSLK
ncbi:unnamed protein product [Coccothraustes coccothraustes]